jgi:crossover junction endodeoxyribonuclease RuvC
MLAIGIDPGTAITGYGLVRLADHGGLETVGFGAVITESATAMPDRLARLHQALADLLALHRPDTAAVEKLFFQKNVSTAMAVGQARGVVLLALAQAGVPTAEYSPREVKIAIAGYGGAGKRQMQAMIRTLLDLPTPPRPDDAADALAVAICHLHTQRSLLRMEGLG